jgi:hypothetical protein
MQYTLLLPINGYYIIIIYLWFLSVTDKYSVSQRIKLKTTYDTHNIFSIYYHRHHHNRIIVIIIINYYQTIETV